MVFVYRLSSSYPKGQRHTSQWAPIFYPRTTCDSSHAIHEKWPFSRDLPKMAIFPVSCGRNVRTRAPTTRDRNMHFRGAFSSGFFWIFVQWIFSFSPGFVCNLVRNSPQNVEKFAPKSGRRKRRRILSRLWLSWFSRSWNGRSQEVETLRAQRLKRFKIAPRATRQTPIFEGNTQA